MPKPRVRTSRRIPPLKDTDCDHEIDLIDRSLEEDEARPLSRTDTQANLLGSTEQSRVDSPNPGGEPASPQQADAEGQAREGREIPSIELPEEENEAVQDELSRPQDASAQTSSRDGSKSRSPRRKLGSSDGRSRNRSQSVQDRATHTHPRAEPETEIDILYENERGGFCCGIPLFSSAALGNLDPPAWTNQLHKPSPTNIRTAQVPDPSWKWAWPDWRVNHDPDDSVPMDKEGWEYSFMFSKKFSWHGPKWWNSFVRRRAWIRRRVKTGMDEGFLNDPHLLNAEYFNVGAEAPQAGKSQVSGHSRSLSKASSHRAGSARLSAGDRMSLSQVSRLSQGFDADPDEAKKKLVVEDADSLMFLLRRSRIDREKIEMVENYLEQGDRDLVRLQEYMHEIMSLFVFQASRRLLLTRLTQIHDEAVAEGRKRLELETGEQEKGKETEKQRDDRSNEKNDDEIDPKGESPLRPQLTPEFGPSETQANADVKAKIEWLAAAVHHADEEVRKLEYWSDVKEMAEAGDSHAVDKDKGWDEGWEGLDKSGAKGANDENLP